MEEVIVPVCFVHFMGGSVPTQGVKTYAHAPRGMEEARKGNPGGEQEKSAETEWKL